MTRMIDLQGQEFGRLVVTGRAPNTPTGKARWSCRCTCGTSAEVRGEYLRSGKTQSCGCLSVEVTQARSTLHGHARVSSWSGTYRTWSAMVRRCTNPNAVQWPYYGGRGISVCDRWRTFANFLTDMGERPEGLTIDRLDVDGDYEIGNCRWATRQEQQHNKRPRRTAA